MLLFVMVNDHLTLALKSFTGQVERETERGRGREQKGSPFTTRGTEQGEKGTARTEDGWTERRREGRVCVCVCVCAVEFLRKREGEGCVPQG